MKTACLLLSLFCFGACCRRFAAQCCAVHGRLHMHSLTQREKASGPPSRTRQHRSLCTESMSWDRLCYRLLLTELPRTIKNAKLQNPNKSSAVAARPGPVALYVSSSTCSLRGQCRRQGSTLPHFALEFRILVIRTSPLYQFRLRQGQPFRYVLVKFSTTSAQTRARTRTHTRARAHTHTRTHSHTLRHPSRSHSSVWLSSTA